MSMSHLTYHMLIIILLFAWFGRCYAAESNYDYILFSYSNIFSSVKLNN